MELGRSPLLRLETMRAPEGFEPSISCLLDRRFNQLSHGAVGETPKQQSKHKDEARDWNDMERSKAQQGATICKITASEI
ncbi:PREDICTED: uncharacterized protein LOC105143509 isoform X2 [Acromyrmex echinatior]|uniref:uncharacterized protein LOC105143509 isoform X2 n=1 Tax=Acromyrmex echinatior TaxID=103372 RepID=UPI000580FD7F|nr:PREDICTED: uncharacterized protein LOC105143509 isoform X2 [Acromyrmex echinatior]XP_011050188.1 PREDICTED: uncharacterized protein LOC105143509 isoform X2 [Acromyrmex echinatior]